MDCNIIDGHMTAEADYALSPEQQELINGLIAKYLSKLKVQMPGENQCPGDCKYYKGHMFRVFTELMTWKNAKAACEARGGHLATSTSAEKNEFLTSLTGGRTAWLGGTDEGTEGTWRWITGETWDYTNWNAGQPDNAGGQEHYLELNYCTSGRWNDLSNHYNLAHVCECEYTPRATLDPKDISHEKLSELLGGNDEGHYHLTKDERTKLGQLSDVLITEGDASEGEATMGAVYAIGGNSETWSEGAEADSYGFRKLNMPKATRLFSLYAGFGAKTPDGMYVCGIRAQDIRLEDTDFGNPTTPKKLPIDDVEEMYAYLYLSVGAGYLSTGYKLSNGNAYEVSDRHGKITDGSVLSVPRTFSYGNYRAIIPKDKHSIITLIPYASGMSYSVLTEKEVKTACTSPENTTISASHTDWIYYVTIDGELRRIAWHSTFNDDEQVEFPYGKIKDIWPGVPSSAHDLFVVTEDNKLYARGCNSAYYLGLPAENTLYSDFTEVGEYAVKKICILASPYYCSYLLTEDGELYHSGYVGGVFGGKYDQNARFTRIFSEHKFIDIAIPPSGPTNHTLVAIIDDVSVSDE